jgi:putative ABC transport system permease protein
MHLGKLVVRNAARSPLRTFMTVLTVAIMLTAFVFPRTLVDGQEKAARDAPNDRVIVLPKQGWSVALPARYGDEVRGMEGIKQATSVRNAGFKLPGNERTFFGSNGIDPVPFIAMHDELVAPDEQKRAFLGDDTSAMVSVDLARERGWKLGDRLVFESWAYPGLKWEPTIRCIYEPVRGEWARRGLYVHYEFLNRALSGDNKDKINLISAQILQPNQGGSIAKAIDLHFDAAPVRTMSMEDRVLAAANLGRIGAILSALDSVSYLILFVVLAILLNTLTLNVRERTREFGVLRAMGFGSGHVHALVLGEAALLGFAGAALGLAISYPFLERLVGPYLQENLNFPETRLPLRVTLTAAGAGISLALLAAWIPAVRLGRLEVREALGRET